MDHLTPPQETFFINFKDDIPGLKLEIEVKQATTLDVAIAAAKAQYIMDKLDEGMDVCVTAGMMEESKRIDMEDPVHRNAIFHIEKIKALANRLIVSWRGPVDDDGKAIPVTEETVAGLMMTFPIGEKFYENVTAWHRKMLAAKKELGGSAVGTTKTAAAPSTAKAAKKRKPSVQKGKRA